MDNIKSIINHLKQIDNEIKQVVVFLEHTQESKQREQQKKAVLVKGENYNPIINRGYFRILEYSGGSKHIQPGKVYKGSTYYNPYYKRKTGYINKPKAYFNESNTTWILSNKEEYDKQK